MKTKGQYGRSQEAYIKLVPATLEPDLEALSDGQPTVAEDCLPIGKENNLKLLFFL